MCKHYFIYALFLVISLTSCGKKWQHQYPEDTERTKETPTERLTNKWWTLKTATFNGVDYTDSIYNMLGSYRIYFTTNINSMQITGQLKDGVVTTNLEGTVGCVWEFSKDESRVVIERANGGPSIISLVPCYTYGFTKNELISYSIQKLNSTELKIKLTNANMDTVIINNYISN